MMTQGIPPDNFNLIDKPFRPTSEFEPIEGLNETIWNLKRQGKLRSALDEIFKVLEIYPDHPQALMLAIPIVGESRMSRLQAEEPLPPSYLLDRRLDSIFTVCSHCKEYNWVSGTFLLGDMAKSMSVTNPVGTQCYNCGYVVCRECLNKLTSLQDDAPIFATCPNCGKVDLDVPVYPTGRLPQQMEKHSHPIIQVIVYREGPILPDNEYLTRLLEIHSPDALQPDVIITGIPVFPWPEEIFITGQIKIIHMESKGEIPVGSSLSTEYAHIEDEDGTQVFIAKIVQPSATQITQNVAERKKIEEASSMMLAKLEKENTKRNKRFDCIRKLFQRGKNKNKFPDYFDNAGPLVRSLRCCKKCDTICLIVGGISCILKDKGNDDHEHIWDYCTEGDFVNKGYDGVKETYLQDIDLLFEETPGLTRIETGRLIWADCLEQLAYLKGEFPTEPAEVHSYRAYNIYDKMSALELAALEFEKAAELSPNNAEYLNQAAIRYFQSDNWDKACKTWDYLLQLHSNPPEAVTNYIAALPQMASKDPEYKLKYYEKAQTLVPNGQVQNRDLGMAYQDEERWEEAIVHLKKAVEFANEPLNFNSVIDFQAKFKGRIASCYYRLRQYSEAAHWWEQALAETDWEENIRIMMQNNLNVAGQLGELLEDYTESNLGLQVQNLIEDHYRRLVNHFAFQQSFIDAKSEYELLVHPDVLTLTKAIIVKELPQSLRNSEHQWKTFQLDDLVLIVSVIPNLDPQEGRLFFSPFYLGFFNEQLEAFIGQNQKFTIIHWIFCSDERGNGIHLSLIPKNGMTLIAQDFLTRAEKSQLGC